MEQQKWNCIVRSAQIHGKLCTCKHEYSSNILFNLKLTSPSPLLLRSCTVKDGQQKLDFACQTCTKRCKSDKEAFKKRNWAIEISINSAKRFQTREDHFTAITSRCCVRKCKRSYDPDYKEKGYCRYGCPERKLCRKCYSQLSVRLTFSSRRQSLRRRSSIVNTAQPVSNTKRIVSIMWHYSIQMEMTQKLTENRLRSVVMIAMTGSVVMVVISGQCFPMASLLMICLMNGIAMHARSKSERLTRMLRGTVYNSQN